MGNLRIFLFLLSLLFSAALPATSYAAVLYILPQSQPVYLGDTFIAEVRLDTEKQEINAAQADLKFPSDLLEIVDVSQGGSILSVTLNKQSESAGQGTLSLAGGVPEGFSGDGAVGRVTFLAKNAGTATVDFDASSRVLLNDGAGTPAALMFLEGSYILAGKPAGLVSVSSPTHPDQNKWSQASTLRLKWDLIEGKEYSYLLSRDPLTEPDETSDRPSGELNWIGEMEYAWLEDGVYYFHLRQTMPDETWGPTATYRAMVDATPPEDFQPKFFELEGKNYIAFNALDKASGIDRYEILEQPRDFLRSTKEKNLNWQEGQSPYLLANQRLNSIVTVKAVDAAGNERIVEVAPPEKPLLGSAAPLIAAVLLLAIIWAIGRKVKKKSAKI